MLSRMLSSVSKQNKALRTLYLKNAIEPKCGDIICATSSKTFNRSHIIFSSANQIHTFNTEDKKYTKQSLNKNSLLYLKEKDNSDDSNISSSSSSPPNESSSGGNDGKDDDDLSVLPYPELGPHMTALSPINVPDVWPSVPVIAIKRTPLFPKYSPS